MSTLHHQQRPSQQQQNQQQQQSLTPQQIVLFSRLNNHLLFHFTPLVEFWQTQRLCVSLDEFEGMLERVGFYKGKEELAEMRENKVEFVGLDRVITGVKQWKAQQSDIVTFMRKQQQHLSQLQKIKTNHNKNHRTLSQVQTRQKNPKTNTRPSSNYQLNSQRNYQQQNHSKLNQINNRTGSRVTNRTTHSSSQYYLQQTTKKQQKALIDLNSTLIRTKNQSQYQLAIKIGQLNDICKRLKNNLTYIIVTSQLGDMEISQKSNKTDTSKIISKKMFQRRYQEFKLQSNNMVDQIQGTLEKDLRETLVQVMYLSDQLEKQIALLKRKGVNVL